MAPMFGGFAPEFIIIICPLVGIATVVAGPLPPTDITGPLGAILLLWRAFTRFMLGFVDIGGRICCCCGVIMGWVAMTQFVPSFGEIPFMLDVGTGPPLFTMFTF